jgi:prepilin-type N-terminal cleavage/methylation domain-containing protein
MRWKFHNKTGFTLLELLMVTLVIGLMLQTLMALVGFVNNRSLRSSAVADVEGLRAAIEEYFAQFGVYPPTHRVDWSYLCTPPSVMPPGMDYGLVTGLYYHLYVGASKETWDNYLEGISVRSDQADYSSWTTYAGALMVLQWTNCYNVIVDPWNREFQYRVGTNYQSYILYSIGPDGIDDTADDVGNSTFNY